MPIGEALLTESFGVQAQPSAKAGTGSKEGLFSPSAESSPRSEGDEQRTAQLEPVTASAEVGNAAEEEE